MIHNDDIIRVIIIEESINEAEIILRSLRKARYPIRPRYVENNENLQQALSEQPEWDLIISVPKIGDFTVAQVCEMVSNFKQDIPIIVVADNLENSITELLKAGATQAVSSDNKACLPIVVGRELKNLAERRERRQFELLYLESQRQNKMLLDSSHDAIAYIHDGVHIYANPSYLKMFDYNGMDDLEGLPIMDLVSINEQAKFKEFMREFMNNEITEEREIKLEGVKSNRKRFPLTMALSQTIYDNESGIQVIIYDKSIEKQLIQLSRHDQLTAQFNNTYFLELLEKALLNARETRTRSVLFYIALDKFSSIKENLGVGGADPVIKNIGNIIKTLSEEGALARFSDNIFTLLITDKDGQKYGEADDIANKICNTIEKNVIELDSQSLVVTCSIGISQILATTGSPQEALNDVRMACQIAQKEGGNRSRKYIPVLSPHDDDEGKRKSSDIAMLIETAQEENRLSLCYQPIVSLQGKTQEIYEVFLRMVDSEGHQVSSYDLFEVAENTNFSIFLDKWVLKTAINVLVDEDKNGHQTVFFIKLSPQTLIKEEEMLEYIRKLLKSTKFPRERLIFEIRESVAIEQMNSAKTFINELKKLKCLSALEHFGTSLNFDTILKHLLVDYVKIDHSYSNGLLNNPENQQALQELVKKVHEFNRETIAVQVEDANSLTVLWSSEVDFAQGHYIQEPIDNLEFDFSN